MEEYEIFSEVENMSSLRLFASNVSVGTTVENQITMQHFAKITRRRGS